MLTPKLRRTVLILAAIVAALVALAPTAALAKGPTAARIDGAGSGGPGNGPRGPVTLRGYGEPGSNSDLGTLADRAGLFPAVFGQTPDPMLDTAPVPAAKLGPRATITWTIPDGGDIPKRIRQDAYPYAAGGPLTYMPPGQPLFDATTRGGWYQAPDSLRTQLIALGLPGKAPAASSPAPVAAQQASQAPAGAAASAPSAWPWAIVGTAAVLAALAGTAALVLRRRPGMVAASTRPGQGT